MLSSRCLTQERSCLFQPASTCRHRNRVPYMKSVSLCVCRAVVFRQWSCSHNLSSEQLAYVSTSTYIRRLQMLNVTNLMQQPTLPLANVSRDGEGEGQGTDHSHRRDVRGHVYFIVAMSIHATKICDILTFCQVCQHGKRVLPLPIVAICRCLLLRFAFKFFSFVHVHPSTFGRSLAEIT